MRRYGIAVLGVSAALLVAGFVEAGPLLQCPLLPWNRPDPPTDAPDPPPASSAEAHARAGWRGWSSDCWVAGFGGIQPGRVAAEFWRIQLQSRLASPSLTASRLPLLSFLPHALRVGISESAKGGCHGSVQHDVRFVRNP